MLGAIFFVLLEGYGRLAASSVVSRPRGMVPFMGRVVILLVAWSGFDAEEEFGGEGEDLVRAEVEVGGVGYGLVLREGGEEGGGARGLWGR